MKQIAISTEYIKLDSFLKFAGVSADGSSAKQLILAGGVTVNGEVCLQRGKKLYPGSVVTAQDESYEVISD